MRVYWVLLCGVLLLCAGCVRTVNTDATTEKVIPSVSDAITDVTTTQTMPATGQNTSRLCSVPTTVTTSGTAELLSEEAVKALVLKHAKVALHELDQFRCTRQANGEAYTVWLYAGAFGYDYTVHAETGKILSSRKQYLNWTGPGTALIGEEKVKETVLRHVGFAEAETADWQITLLAAVYRSYTYAADFSVGKTAYWYDINARTGDVLDHGTGKRPKKEITTTYGMPTTATRPQPAEGQLQSRTDTGWDGEKRVSAEAMAEFQSFLQERLPHTGAIKGIPEYRLTWGEEEFFLNLSGGWINLPRQSGFLRLSEAEVARLRKILGD